jgi:hypothetical protein
MSRTNNTNIYRSQGFSRLNNPEVQRLLNSNSIRNLSNQNLKNAKNILGITFDDIEIPTTNPNQSLIADSYKNWRFTTSMVNGKLHRTSSKHRGIIHLIKVSVTVIGNPRGGHTFAAWLLTSENGHRGSNSQATYLYIVDAAKGHNLEQVALVLSQYYKPDYIRIYKGPQMQPFGTNHCSWIAKKLLIGKEMLTTVATQIWGYKKLNFAELDRTAENVLRKYHPQNKMCKLNRIDPIPGKGGRYVTKQANAISRSIKKRLQEHKNRNPSAMTVNQVSNSSNNTSRMFNVGTTANRNGNRINVHNRMRIYRNQPSTIRPFDPFAPFDNRTIRPARPSPFGGNQRNLFQRLRW